MFSFGNTRIDYEDNTVSSAVFMTNFAKPRAKLLTKSYNPKTKRTEIVVQEKEKVEKIRHQAKTIVQQKVEIYETNQHLERKKDELEHKEQGRLPMFDYMILMHNAITYSTGTNENTARKNDSSDR